MRVSSVLAPIGLVVALILAQPSLAQPVVDAVKPFTTDGCSVWIDGPPKSPYLWRHCCVAHDLAYWQGGAESAKVKADKDLQACIADLAGPAMANYMYFFVTTGGSPLWLTPYRWGYGWNYLKAGKPRGYKILTPDEQAQVDTLMPQAIKTVAEDAEKHPATATSLRIFK
ncbi:helicase [Cellvibrio sp.]|uniref:helicase n=1 Tax=Cellvibrio sp. TaxID=1965322 RepID=UPI0039647D1E